MSTQCRTKLILGIAFKQSDFIKTETKSVPNCEHNCTTKFCKECGKPRGETVVVTNTWAPWTKNLIDQDLTFKEWIMDYSTIYLPGSISFEAYQMGDCYVLGNCLAADGSDYNTYQHINLNEITTNSKNFEALFEVMGFKSPIGLYLSRTWD